MQIRNNVAYRTYGHCFLQSDGSERFSTFTNNLAIDAQGVGDEDPNQLLPTDSAPTMFFITNPDNHWFDNAAVT
jgi:hypothetical protein